jgi:hypothetical protein
LLSLESNQLLVLRGPKGLRKNAEMMAGAPLNSRRLVKARLAASVRRVRCLHPVSHVQARGADMDAVLEGGVLTLELYMRAALGRSVARRVSERWAPDRLSSSVTCPDEVALRMRKAFPGYTQGEVTRVTSLLKHWLLRYLALAADAASGSTCFQAGCGGAG